MSLLPLTLLMTFMSIYLFECSPLVFGDVHNKYLIVKNEEKLLISVLGSGMVMANINDNQDIDSNVISIYNTTSNIVSIEFDYIEKYLIWLEGDVIKKANFNPKFDNYIRTESIEIIVESGVSAFTFDWTHRLIYYWVKAERQIIAHHITDQKKFKVVIHETEQNVGDIAVDPIRCRIFYSQWDRDERYGQIMSANQDGSDRIDLTQKSLRKPSSLTIDLVEKQVYFIDKITYRLSSIDYNGNYKTIITAKDYFKFSKSLNFLRKKFYWPSLASIYLYLSDSQQHQQYPKKIISQQQYIDSIKIWSIFRQPNEINRCSDNRCSYLCLPSGPHNYSCVCPQTSNEGECKESTNRVQISSKNMYLNGDTITTIIPTTIPTIITTTIPTTIPTIFHTTITAIIDNFHEYIAFKPKSEIISLIILVILVLILVIFMCISSIYRRKDQLKDETSSSIFGKICI